MAEQLGKLFAAGRFSQLQMETKNAFHQAAVVSVKLEEKDIAGWNEIIRAMEKAHPEKLISWERTGLLILKLSGKA